MMPNELPSAEIAKDIVLDGPEAPPDDLLPDKRQCLTCAFGVLLVSRGAQSEGRTQAASVISGAQEITSYNVRTRATIYRCGVTTCRTALIAFTMLNQSPIQADRDNLHVEKLPGTSGCLIPSSEWPQVI